jgi:hypothetical protein
MLLLRWSLYHFFYFKDNKQRKTFLGSLLNSRWNFFQCTEVSANLRRSDKWLWYLINWDGYLFHKELSNVSKFVEEAYPCNCLRIVRTILTKFSCITPSHLSFLWLNTPICLSLSCDSLLLNNRSENKHIKHFEIFFYVIALSYLLNWLLNSLLFNTEIKTITSYLLTLVSFVHGKSYFVLFIKIVCRR